MQRLRGQIALPKLREGAVRTLDSPRSAPLAAIHHESMRRKELRCCTPRVDPIESARTRRQVSRNGGAAPARESKGW